MRKSEQYRYRKMKIHGSVLLLVTLCLMSSSECSSSDMNRFASPTMSNLNDRDMNSLSFSIKNVMSPNQPKVFFFYNYDKTRIYLQPGRPFTKATNFDRTVIIVYWDVLCSIFYGYDPNTDGTHQRIYWLVKEDGVFHSWNNKNWQKRKTWRNDGCWNLNVLPMFLCIKNKGFMSFHLHGFFSYISSAKSLT